MTYNEFIQNILDTRGRFSVPEGVYKEKHHIIPKCLGGTNDGDNLIDLYAREHFEAHRLLALENPKNNKLVSAWWLMCSCKRECQERYEVTAEEYEKARIAFSERVKERQSGKNHYLYGKHPSEETRRKMSLSRKGRPSGMKGKCGKDSPSYGRKASDEVRLKMSLSKRGKYLRGNNPLAKKVICEGQVYACAEDCADAYGITGDRMRHLLCMGFDKMPLKWQTRGLKYYKD